MTQRRNLIETVRPELHISGWEIQHKGGEDGRSEITFSHIKNVGRGSAFHVMVSGGEREDHGEQSYVMSAKRFAILAPGEEAGIDGSATIWWAKVPARKQLPKSVPLKIRLWCWDTVGRRYLIDYNLHVWRSEAVFTSSDDIVPGITLSHRTTTTSAVWWLKVKKHTRRQYDAIAKSVCELF